MGSGSVTKEQALAFLGQYADADEAAASLVDTYWQEAKQEGVRPEVAFALAMLETDFLKYDSGVTADMNNPGGLKDGNGDACGFESLVQGIRAHIQHLKCYASSDSCKNDIVDPLWQDDSRGVVEKIADIEKMGYTESGGGDRLTSLLTEMKNK